MPGGIALACACALGLQACFNPQPEPPAKSGSFVPENDESVADAASSGGDGGAGGSGGQGGAGSSESPTYDMDRHPTSSVTSSVTTSGGATSLLPPHTK
jgi:hypothetical protein